MADAKEGFMQVIRYKNRKMFVPRQGYVTLNEICEAMQRGVNVQVTDHKNKNDITNETLLRAIGENFAQGFKLERGDIVSLLNKMEIPRSLNV